MLVGFQVLRQGHFDQRPSHAPVIVFKRVNGFQRTYQAIGFPQAVVEPLNQPRHLRMHVGRIGRQVMDDVGLAHA